MMMTLSMDYEPNPNPQLWTPLRAGGFVQEDVRDLDYRLHREGLTLTLTQNLTLTLNWIVGFAMTF